MILVQLSDTAVTMTAVMVSAETDINIADSTQSATSKLDETVHVVRVW
jgi:hypothetical protein